MHDLEPSYQQQYPSAPGGEAMPMSGGRLMVEPEGLGLRECIRLLRKHLQLITLCFIGSLLVTAVIILLTPPTYTGKVTLLIERNTPQVLNFREVLGEQRDSETYDFYKTQYEILKKPHPRRPRPAGAAAGRFFPLHHQSPPTGHSRQALDARHTLGGR